jgi:hypothetical protein
MDINLSLSLEEVNGIMAALGQMPFGQVEPLVNKIRQQAIPQAQAIQEADQEVEAVTPKTK